MSRTLIRGLLLGLALVLISRLAPACPVCFDAEEDARRAYATGTAVMTLLPLAVMGSAALWVRKRLRGR